MRVLDASSEEYSNVIPVLPLRSRDLVRTERTNRRRRKAATLADDQGSQGQMRDVSTTDQQNSDAGAAILVSHYVTGQYVICISFACRNRIIFGYRRSQSVKAIINYRVVIIISVSFSAVWLEPNLHFCRYDVNFSYTVLHRRLCNKSVTALHITQSPAVVTIADHTGCQWPWRSSKVDDFHFIWKGVCRFLLVINNRPYLAPFSHNSVTAF